jgi:hypothetical protein
VNHRKKRIILKTRRPEDIACPLLRASAGPDIQQHFSSIFRAEDNAKRETSGKAASRTFFPEN